jgi:hypothetical protein
VTAHFIIDCGSRSIKLHRVASGSVSLQATRSWDPLGDGASVGQVGDLLAALARTLPRAATVQVVGTAAARRDPAVARAVAAACAARRWSYRTLSQATEAALIRDAFGGRAVCDIVNAGGGSIQIVGPSGDPVLLEFGITDLNARFGLALEPHHRQPDAAMAFVLERLPRMGGPFIYSGGELSYLRALGATLTANGRCTAAEFLRLAAEVDIMTEGQLQRLSPGDPQWSSGAIASNAIVRACLSRSGAGFYYASDINIADGIIRGLAGRAADAGHAGV